MRHGTNIGGKGMVIQAEPGPLAEWPNLKDTSPSHSSTHRGPLNKDRIL